MSIEDILRLFGGEDRNTKKDTGGIGCGLPPLDSEARKAAAEAAREALAPRQSDEAHLVIRPFGPDGDILVRSEQWLHEATGLKVVTHEVRVLTCTGELVEPKGIRVVCLVCGGQDCVVNHCRCGTAVCRRCLRHDPADSSPLCPACHQQAIETFNTWKAHDLQRFNTTPKHD